MRNPRRAYRSDGTAYDPMTLDNMRAHGVRSVDATCEACKREAIINVDGWPDDYPVPDVGLRLVCSQCGGKDISTRPNWREHARPSGTGHYPPAGEA